MRLALFNEPARADAVADQPVSGHQRLPISAVLRSNAGKGRREERP
jgi:hypothetical protein